MSVTYPPNTSRLLRAPFLIAALVLSGVGIADDSSPASAAEMKVFELELNDGVITPNRIEVEAGVAVKIILRNSGTSAAEFESLQLRKEKVLGPGVTSFVVLRRLSPGTYKFYDEFHMDKKSAHGVIVAK